METKLFESSSLVALGLCALAAMAGCNGNPAPGSEAYKAGSLGNGDFLFSCDDGAACTPYSGDAKKFPKQIASGSTFQIRFVSKNEEGNDITVNDHKYVGVTTSGLAPYVTTTPDGMMLAEKVGYGTVLARDSANTIVDYTTVHIVQPDALIVYDANAELSTDPDSLTHVSSVTMQVEDRKSYRVVAAKGGESVAGSIPVEWESDSSDIVEVETTGHVVSVHAKKTGKAVLTANGGGTKKTVEVEVQ